MGSLTGLAAYERGTTSLGSCHGSSMASMSSQAMVRSQSLRPHSGRCPWPPAASGCCAVTAHAPIPTGALLDLPVLAE